MFSSINFPEGTKAENLKRGQELVAENKFADAITIYNRWLLYLNKDVDFLKARAAAFLKNKQREEAAKDLALIITIQKEEKIQHSIKSSRDCLENIHQKMLKDPNEQYNENTRKAISKRHYELGIAYSQLKDTEMAKSHFLCAIGFDENLFVYPEEVQPENIIQEDERVVAFKYLQEMSEHKVEAVKEISTKISTIKNYISKHEELIILFRKRALIYKDLMLYPKALEDLVIASWLNLLPSFENAKKVIILFDLYELCIDIFIEMLNAPAAFYVKLEMIRNDSKFREITNSLKHLKLSQYQREKRFWNLILKKCHSILSAKKHTPNAEEDIKAIDFLHFVLNEIPKIDANVLKKEDLSIFTEHKVQEWFQGMVRGCRARNQLSDVIKLYKYILEKWPDNAIFQKGLRATEIEADPSFKDEATVLHEKNCVTVIKVPSVKEFKEHKKEPLYAVFTDNTKTSGAIILQELMQDKKLKKEKTRVARNKRNGDRSNKHKTTSRRVAKTIVDEEKSREEHVEEVQRQQKEALALKQKEEMEQRKSKENELRQKTVDDFKRGIELRQAIYEKQKIEFEKRRAEKKSDEISARIKISRDAWLVLDALENGGKAEIFGGAVRDGVFQLFGLETNEIISDLDIKATTNPSQIVNVLAHLNVQPVFIKDEKGGSIIKEGFFEIKTIFVNELKQINSFNMQISHKSDEVYLAETKEIDFTINTLTANKFGEVRDPTGLGLKHIKDRVLATVNQSSAESFKQDPSRTLRGGFYKCKYKLTADDELMANMEEFSSQIPTMKEVFRIHSWMKSHFSCELVSSVVAVENFKFLQQAFQHPKTKNEWNFLNKLFSPAAANKIMLAENWVLDQFRQGAHTIADIYMIFFIAIAMNTSTYSSDPANTKKTIFYENPLLADALGRPGFRFTFEKYLQRWPTYQSLISFQLYRPNTSISNATPVGIMQHFSGYSL